MTAEPTFGLLIPCKNGTRFLPRLFASVRAQTRPFDQIWLFDDGSSDGSGEMAAALGAQVLRSENSLGPSAARNRLSSACPCDWLHFHDVDDTMDPHYLERVGARVRPEVDMVICDMLWIEEETGRVENRWHYDAAAIVRYPTSYFILNTVGGINGLYRRTKLLASGGYNESLGYWEDMECNLRLVLSGAGIEVVNEYLVMAYRRRDSYSNSNLGEVWRVKLRIMDQLRATSDADLLAVIANEAETIAGRLADLGLWRDVPSALQLAQRAGGNPPTTSNPILRLLKHLLPRTRVFRLQLMFRKFLTK